MCLPLHTSQCRWTWLYERKSAFTLCPGNYVTVQKYILIVAQNKEWALCFRSDYSWESYEYVSEAGVCIICQVKANNLVELFLCIVT